MELSRLPTESLADALTRVNHGIDADARTVRPTLFTRKRRVEAAPTRVVGKNRGKPPPWWDPHNRDVWADLTT